MEAGSSLVHNETCLCEREIRCLSIALRLPAGPGCFSSLGGISEDSACITMPSAGLR